ncbi:hypothetical protein [Brasilonema bromeliae]|uniref:Uncharacterized protein n=1 Tax=Brasilonema bromeliae SPC951 TaxID=385972 RepID=A0ABX1P9J8_9CYAN|nr:hypothetical protein [Brasilonema bromeliae]NMG21090.1 hypothetical protein [Brasilonema bromeliae SPC951]
MDSLNGDSKSTFLEDLQSGLDNTEHDNILALSVLSNTIEILEKIVIKISQFGQTGAQLKNSKHKDSQVIESLDLNSGQRPEVEDRVELLCEQVETLKQLLYDKELELQEIKQELRDTNEDLWATLNSPWLALDEAKELVKEILVSKKPIAETLATLITTIYNSTVKPLELGHKEKSNSIKLLISAPGNFILTNNEAYQMKSTALIKQAREIRAKSKILREESREVQAKFREVEVQFMKLESKFVRQASFMLLTPNFRHRQKPKAIELADVSPPAQLLDFGV